MRNAGTCAGYIGPEIELSLFANHTNLPILIARKVSWLYVALARFP